MNSTAENAIAALEAAGKAATPGPLIQDGRFVEVNRDGDFISEHFAQHNISHGDPVAIAQANAALHVAAVNLSAPLAAVARAAMARPWYVHGICVDYRCVQSRGESHHVSCRYRQIDAALDALEAAAEGAA